MRADGISQQDFHHAGEQLKKEIVQLSALSHILNDDGFSDWTAVIRAPLQQLVESLMDDICNLTRSMAGAVEARSALLRYQTA